MSAARLQLEQHMREEEDRADAECERVLRAKAMHPQQRDNLVARRIARKVGNWWAERPPKKPVTNCEIAALLRSLRRLED